MNHLELTLRQLDPDIRGHMTAKALGDEVTVTITGHVCRIEADMVDVSTIDRVQYVAGEKEIELAVTRIEMT